MTDGRVARGDRTRAAVLDGAVALATEEGLDGLSLGQLAVTLGVSKSGLFAHWRSKEDLQLATIERAREQWATHVVAPALQAPRGMRRLWALHESRVNFYAAEVLPGGCFFANAEFEFNARPGPVRDRLAEIFEEWMTLLERLVAEAVAEGELQAGRRPAAAGVRDRVARAHLGDAGAPAQARRRSTPRPPRRPRPPARPPDRAARRT